MTPHDLRQQVVLKSFWARIAGLDPAEARQHAIREIAAEHRAQRKLNAASHPVAPLRDGRDDPRVSLVRKVMDMLSRLPRPVVKRVRLHDHPSPAPTTAPAPQPSLVQRVVESLVSPEPEQTSTPQRPTLRSEGSSAVLVDDLPHRSGNDFIVDNWRRSIEANNIIDFERRQRVQPEKKLNLYVG